MADFASAAMPRLLAQGMRDLGLQVPPAAAATVQGATVPLTAKRDLVAAACAQGGLGCLPLLGRGLHRFTHEPTHRALTAARDGADLLARWARLERYVHSRHRVEVLALAEGQARMQHRALAPHPPPLAVESLVVLGVLAALLEAIGAQHVAVRIGSVEAFPQPDGDGLAALARQGALSAWSLHWRKVSTPHAKTQRAPRPALQPPPGPPLAQRAFALLAADPIDALPLRALAAELGCAPRSLQRALRAAVWSYARLRSEVRQRQAAADLLGSTAAVAEIGFACGYADQPHFTRDFKRVVGLTPARYRREFGAPADESSALPLS